jgi:putative salt-induced outer membrane protein YdiY
LSFALAAAAQAQTPPPATPDAATRAADAAEKAAAAAQKAAEAAQSAAEASAKSAAAAEKVATAAPAAAGAKPAEGAKPPAPPAPKLWSGLLGFGLIAISGNAEALSFKASAAFEYKTPEWIFGLKANGIYGTGRPIGATESQVNAYAAGIQLRGDRRFSDQVSAYLLFGDSFDHVNSIEQRPIGEAGLGLIWWDVKEADFQKSTLRTDLGFRYGREFRFQYYPTPLDLPDVDIIAPHVGALLRYAINKDVIFTQDADLVASFANPSRLLITANSKLAARLTDAMSLAIGFTVSYDSAPAPNRQSTDTSLSVGLDVAL